MMKKKNGKASRENALKTNAERENLQNCESQLLAKKAKQEREAAFCSKNLQFESSFVQN